MPTKPERNAACPCGSGRKAKRCCLPVLEGAPALDPVALLRSRYCAYGWGDVDHLLATSTLPASERASLAAYCATLALAGLEIGASSVTGDAGTVCYTARLVLGGRPVVLREEARYARIRDRWIYVGGEVG